MKTIMGEKYRLSYKLYYKNASDALRAKLKTIKENPDSELANDDDVKKFIRNICDLAESEEVS